MRMITSVLIGLIFRWRSWIAHIASFVCYFVLSGISNLPDEVRSFGNWYYFMVGVSAYLVPVAFTFGTVLILIEIEKKKREEEGR